MGENGIAEKGTVEQYHDGFCNCPGLRDVKAQVWVMDCRARELDEYAGDLNDERVGDSIFMHALSERMANLHEAMRVYDEEVLVATGKGHIAPGVPTPPGEVEYVSIREAGRRARTSRLGKICNWFWGLFGYETEPLENDGFYCSNCSKLLPKIQYRDWTFESA